MRRRVSWSGVHCWKRSSRRARRRACRPRCAGCGQSVPHIRRSLAGAQQRVMERPHVGIVRRPHAQPMGARELHPAAASRRRGAAGFGIPGSPCRRAHRVRPIWSITTGRPIDGQDREISCRADPSRRSTAAGASRARPSGARGRARRKAARRRGNAARRRERMVEAQPPDAERRPAPELGRRRGGIGDRDVPRNRPG